MWSMYAYMTLCRLQKKHTLYSDTTDWAQVGNYVPCCFSDKITNGEYFTVLRNSDGQP